MKTHLTTDQRKARYERGLKRQQDAQQQRGKLGILVNGSYVFWNAAHTGYCFCRIEHGVETEIAECIPKTALDPYARVVFVREGPALVAVDPNSLDAVNIYGQAAPALGVPSQPMGNRGSGDWTPTDGNILLANGTQFSSTPLATAFEDWIGYLASGASFALTVASNVLTVGTESSVVVSPQTGTTDDVQQVIVSGFPRLLLLIAAAGCTITLKQFVGGSDNIYVFGGADLAFTDIEVALGWWDGTKLFVTGGGGGSGGGFYQTVQDNGADQTQRGKLNFIGATIADNPGNDSTDVTVSGGSGGGGLPYSIAKLSADVTMTSPNTFYDGASVSLGAGTWSVMAGILMSDADEQVRFTAKLWDGASDVQASAEYVQFDTSYPMPFTLAGIFVLTGTTTIRISGASNGSSGKILAAAPDNGAGNNAGWIAAVEISSGGGGSSPVLIYDYTLPSDGTFDTNNADDSSRTGILQTYADLEIRIDGGAASGVTPGVEIFLNGDTNTAHYVANRQVNAGGFDPGSINEIGFLAGNGDYDLLKIEVGGYAKTAYTKRMIGRSVTGTTPTLVDYWLYFNQTGALTRFQAHCRSAGNFQAGTRIRIYGIP